jgi:hypothetical protein
MAFTLSAPVKFAALGGLLLTVVLFGGFKLMGSGGSSDDTVAAPKIIKHHPFGPGAAKKTPTAPKVTAKTPVAHKAAKPKHVVKPKVKAQPKPALDLAAIKAALAAGLPAPVAQALGTHKSVVVSLYDPYSQVDGTSFAEAKAGAVIAGAGFVALNVLSQRDVGKLTEQLGLLPDPGVLVYIRPGTLAAKIEGFADKETVAQAATNAARGS